MANFIAKFTHAQDDEKSPKITWIIQIDGSATKMVEGAGFVLISPKGEIMKYAVRLQFPATNNEAEYEVLLTGLKLARVVTTKDVTI